MEYDKCTSIQLVKALWEKIFDIFKKCIEFDKMIEGRDTYDDCNTDGKDLDWYGPDPPKKVLTKLYKE